MKREQHNVRIATKIKSLATADRTRFCTTNDIVAEVALLAWFTKYTPEQRGKFYRTHDLKPYSRGKVSA